MTVLYFGNYNPNYSRNRILINGLRENGVKVIECNVRKSGFRSFFTLFLKYLRLKASFDFMVVGFPGQEAMFLARFLTLRFGLGRARKPIVFDAFTSHYGGYILDRQYYSLNSFRAKYYRFLDKWSCKLASFVLLDTNAHIDFFVREFGLPKEKFRRILVGANSDIFYPRNGGKSDDKFLVHFHGHYIPLQGVKYIIQAAKLLEKENISFNLIGRGQTFEEDRKLARRLKLKNINFIDSVPYDKLPNYMAKADVCLGIFGNSPKTDLVIPNKIYEGLAMRKPVITSDTLATRELLSDGVDVFLCQKADPKSLAEKILMVRNQPDILKKAAQNGRRLFEEKLKERILAGGLIKYINDLKKTALRK